MDQSTTTSKTFHARQSFTKTLAQKSSVLAEAKKAANALGLSDEYLRSWQENIFAGRMPDKFQKMFNAGDGGELICKACAIHSSSMLAYNMFHWIDENHPFSFGKSEYTDVLFEVKIPCLNGKSGQTVNANMDVVLISRTREEVLFIESKFTEHFTSASRQMKDISEAYYRDRDQKRYISKKYPGILEVVRHFKEEAEASCRRGGNKGYYDGIKQELCHLIALTNLIEDKAVRTKFIDKHLLNTDFKLKFVNLIFRPAHIFEKEFALYERYCDLYGELIRKIKGNIPPLLILEDHPLTYTDLWQEMKPQIADRTLRAYINDRYMCPDLYS